MARTMFLAGVAALVVGCSTTYPKDGDGDLPDGGVGETDGGDGSGSGSGSGSGGGSVSVSVVPGTIKDERGDVISFSSGAPIHTHAGATIALETGTACPAVYKYSYLMDPQAPQFGGETTPNALEWKFSAAGGAIASARYRILRGSETERDWTAVSPVSGGDYRIAVHRSGAQGVPALHSIAGEYRIELEVTDQQGQTGTASACWEHRPLAAPLRFTGLAAHIGVEALPAFRFAQDSPVSQLMSSTEAAKIFAGGITHATAEGVTLKFDIPVPSASYTKQVVNDLLAYGTGLNLHCKTTCSAGHPTCVEYRSPDYRCNESAPPVDPSDPTSAGPLTGGNWKVVVLEGGAVSSQCTVTGRTATCGLPARVPGAPARELSVEVRANQLEQLKPGVGIVNEYTTWGRTYTGLALDGNENQTRCATWRTESGGVGITKHFCTSYTTWSTLHALDSVTLDIGASAMTVSTAIPPKDGRPGTTLSAPPYVPEGKVNGTGFAWDSGNDDLPGDAH